MSEKDRAPAMKKYTETFDEYLKGADRLTTSLLHTHLFTGHLLERLVRTQLAHPDRILEELTYYRKLKLAEALDVLPENLAEALGKLNALRNKVAHEKGYKVAREKLEEICRITWDDKHCGELLNVVAQGDRVDFGDVVFGAVFNQLLTHTIELELQG